MHDHNQICLKKIKQNLKGVKDAEIRRKAYLIIQILESKKNISLACKHAGIVRQTFYRWCARLRAADYDISALSNKSRRPHNSPNKTPDSVEDELLKLRKANANKGGKYIAKVYEKETGIQIAGSTVDAIFSRRNVVEPRKKPKPNPHTRRYAMKTPLERVQMDSVGLGIEDVNGNKVCAISAIDDCSRFVFLDICHTKGAIEARDALKKFIAQVGKPKLVQTDNGVEFTCKFNSFLNANRTKEAKVSGFEEILIDEKIKHHLIRPRTPQLNGKIERFHRTIKRELDLQALNGQPFEVIVKAIQDWLHWYNHKRYHSSLNYLTPHEEFTKKLKKEAS
jgi:transposase InsO family protein